jgi:Cupredoxin-like domain
MVSRAVIFAIVVIAILAVSAAYYISSTSSSGGGVIINMEVTDGTPQDGGPDEILPQNFTVTQGQHVTVVFENTDDGPHEIVAPGLGFTTNIVQGGQTARVALNPSKVGTFGFYQPAGACVSQADPAVSCTGPQLMNGTITVLPAP